MPETDGFEVIHAMLNAQPGARIIAMSGRTTEAQRLDKLRAARQIGALWTLRKPFDDIALINAVKLALAKPAKTKARVADMAASRRPKPAPPHARKAGRSAS